jgi:hypothetical protein
VALFDKGAEMFRDSPNPIAEIRIRVRGSPFSFEVSKLPVTCLKIRQQGPAEFRRELSQ